MTVRKNDETEEELPEAEESMPEELDTPVDNSTNSPTDTELTEEMEPEKVVAASHVTIRYVGIADVFYYGPYVFRPGQLARLPSDVAEELLTYPYEQFEVKE